MRWGHRKPESAEVTRYKNELTKRKQEYKVAKRQYNKESIFNTASSKTIKELGDASRELRYSREDLSKSKILDKLNSKPKSSYQLKMEDKYKKQGMSNDEAAVAAYKNIRFKKIAAIAAVTAVTAGGIAAGMHYRNEFVDKIIKSGTSLQNISTDSDKGIRDAFYSAKSGLDKAKYKGIYGSTLSSSGKSVFNKNIKVLKDIKQASPRNAQKVLSDLVKNDKDFAKAIKDYTSTNKLGSKYMKKNLKARESLITGKVDKNLYEVLNASLADHSPEMQKISDKYFKALSEKGYNAIKDVNDAKYSGYNTSNPIISFGTKGKVVVDSVKQLSKDEIAKNAIVGYAHALGIPLIKTGAKVGLAAAGTKGVMDYLLNKKDIKVANNYRKTHPKTKLTNTEIIRMIERGGKK